MIYQWFLRYLPAPIAFWLTALAIAGALLLLFMYAGVDQAEVRYLQF